MKVFAISDLHLSINNPKPMDIFGGAWDNYWDKIKQNWTEVVSPEDIVLIAGDISWALKLEDAIPDLQEIDTLTGKKIIIRGNHDYWWASYSKVKNILPKNILAVQNNAIKFDTCVICGTRGWTIPTAGSSEHDKKIYARELIRLKLTLDEATKLSENNLPIILMLHYPPFNALWQDSEITQLIEQYKNVKAVIYGHLHGKDCRTKDIIVKNEIPYYLTSCDQVNNELQLIFDSEQLNNEKDNNIIKV